MLIVWQTSQIVVSRNNLKSWNEGKTISICIDCIDRGRWNVALVSIPFAVWSCALERLQHCRRVVSRWSEWTGSSTTFFVRCTYSIWVAYTKADSQQLPKEKAYTKHVEILILPIETAHCTLYLHWSGCARMPPSHTSHTSHTRCRSCSFTWSS